jgi:4-diphosphocytidyl-2C-methyl-D-erythritol kinase
MTGSGSACFGFFEDESIDLALRKISKDHPDWLVKKTFLNDL